jgi:hypothetical protein
MAWTNFRVADRPGVGRFVKAAALLAIHPGKSYARANFLEGEFGGVRAFLI